MPHLESKQKWNFCPAQLSSEFTPTLFSPGWSILSCVDWYLEGEWMAWTLLCRPVPLESAPLPASPSHCKRMGTHLLRLLRAQQSCPCTNPAQCPVSNPHGLHSLSFSFTECTPAAFVFPGAFVLLFVKQQVPDYFLKKT